MGNKDNIAAFSKASKQCNDCLEQPSRIDDLIKTAKELTKDKLLILEAVRCLAVAAITSPGEAKPEKAISAIRDILDNCPSSTIRICDHISTFLKDKEDSHALRCLKNVIAAYTQTPGIPQKSKHVKPSACTHN
jgi:hypothetical protein